MSQNKVILLLGTNLGDKIKNLETAKINICKDIGLIKKTSNILENKADGFTTENLFLNQKIEIQTSLSPFKLLDEIKLIERKMGRTYYKPLNNEKYVDRIIDIDILFFNKIFIDSNRLNIPHEQNYTRSFVKSLIFY